VSLTNGFFSAVLGADEDDNPLDTDVLEQAPLWLEFQVTGQEPMTPRQPLVSVPYAAMAGVAERIVGGMSWADISDIPAGFSDGVDADSLAGFSCQEGDILVWDALLVDWACTPTVYTDTQLTEAQVDAFVANNGYALAANLAAIATSGDWSDLGNVPAGLDDGDDDTQLSESTVEGYITNGAIDLAIGSSVGGSSMLTATDLGFRIYPRSTAFSCAFSSGTARCDNGGLALGGGCTRCTGHAVDDSYPQSTTTWSCDLTPGTNSSGTFTAYVICIDVN
jgi:hypothetical protein